MERERALLRVGAENDLVRLHDLLNALSDVAQAHINTCSLLAAKGRVKKESATDIRASLGTQSSRVS
jgi:hypothetical protein